MAASDVAATRRWLLGSGESARDVLGGGRGGSGSRGGAAGVELDAYLRAFDRAAADSSSAATVAAEAGARARAQARAAHVSVRMAAVPTATPWLCRTATVAAAPFSTSALVAGATPSADARLAAAARAKTLHALRRVYHDSVAIRGEVRALMHDDRQAVASFADGSTGVADKRATACADDSGGSIPANARDAEIEAAVAAALRAERSGNESGSIHSVPQLLDEQLTSGYVTPDYVGPDAVPTPAVRPSALMQVRDTTLPSARSPAAAARAQQAQQQHLPEQSREQLQQQSEPAHGGVQAPHVAQAVAPPSTAPAAPNSSAPPAARAAANEELSWGLGAPAAFVAPSDAVVDTTKLPRLLAAARERMRERRKWRADVLGIAGEIPPPLPASVAEVFEATGAGEAALATDAAAEAQQAAPRVLSATADAQDDPAGGSEDELEVRWGADVGCHGRGGVGSHALAFRRSNA